MIDFGLSKGQLEFAGLVCAAAMVAIPFLKCALGGARKLGGRLSLPTIIVLALCMVQSLIVGGTKTNGVNNLPPQQMMLQGGGSFLTGFTGLTGLSGAGNLVNLVNPVQQTFAERMVWKWNVRGAFDDSLWLDFEDGFVFPEGTNHLEGVEVLASGEIWRTPFDTNAVATIGAAVSIVPGLSSFAYEHTLSNSYRFVWTDAAINRDTNNLVSAALELFRNGDVSVTTNGIAAHLPRILPFPHNGFGQDDEWVTENFTNATEILAQGYTNWVASAAASETNGFFSFSVMFPKKPPEVLLLEVGDFSVAVTNAGDYVFLLENGVRHRIYLSYIPDCVTYAISGGAHCPAMLMRGAIGNPLYSLRIVATGDEGEGSELVEPTSTSEGYVICWPWLSIAPVELTNPCFPILFHADVFGIPDAAIPCVTWERGGEIIATGENLLLTGDEEDIEPVIVTATYRDVELQGSISFERHIAASDISLLGGGLLVVEDAYTNSPTDVVSGSSTSVGLRLAWSLREEGTLCLSTDYPGVVITNEFGTAITLPHSWHGYADDEDEWELYASLPDSSLHTGNAGALTFTFTPDEGGAFLSRTVALQVVKVRVEADADWPSNKVRHVFGPREQFAIHTNPQMSLSVCSNSYVSVSGTSVTAPDRDGVFSVMLTSSAGSHDLVFTCIAPTCLSAGNPRGLYEHEWHALVGQPLSAGEAGVVMHFDSWLEPSYVSFKHLLLYEGFAPTSNRTGWFLDLAAFPEELLQHGEGAGMGSGESNRNFGISDVGNLTLNGDYVGMWIGEWQAYYNGSYQLNIPLLWYVEGGEVTNSLPNNVQTAWVYTNGTMRVQKNGITWERTIEGVSHQVIE